MATEYYNKEKSRCLRPDLNVTLVGRKNLLMWFCTYHISHLNWAATHRVSPGSYWDGRQTTSVCLLSWKSCEVTMSLLQLDGTSYHHYPHLACKVVLNIQTCKFLLANQHHLWVTLWIWVTQKTPGYWGSGEETNFWTSRRVVELGKKSPAAGQNSGSSGAHGRISKRRGIWGDSQVKLTEVRLCLQHITQ